MTEQLEGLNSGIIHQFCHGWFFDQCIIPAPTLMIIVKFHGQKDCSVKFLCSHGVWPMYFDFMGTLWESGILGGECKIG